MTGYVQKATEGHANLYVMNLRRELKNLFEAMVEIECTDSATLFEAMLYPFLKHWIDQRDRLLDTDTEIQESLHHAIDQAFHQTVIHSARYMQIDQVPDDKRQMVKDRMLR